LSFVNYRTIIFITGASDVHAISLISRAERRTNLAVTGCVPMKIQTAGISTATTSERIDIQPPEVGARIFDMPGDSEKLERERM